MRKGKKGLLLLALGVVLALGAAIAVVTEVNLRPIILNTAESRVRAIALDAVNSAIARNLSAITYEDLIRVDTDGQGRVTLLQANTVNMNRISTQTALTAQQYIADIADQSIRISIGSATGSPLLAGRGPETRHKVYIRIRANMRIVIPTGAREVEVVAQVPVAETVIVGQVPQSYVNVDSTEDMLNLLPDMSGS